MTRHKSMSIEARNSDENSPGTCNQCKKPKRVTRSGTLTGWIFNPRICSCDAPATKTASASATNVCAVCKKTITENKTASITQWVFGTQDCDCQRIARPANMNRSRMTSEDRSTQAPNTVSAGIEDAELTQQLGLPERYSVIRRISQGGSGFVNLTWDKLLRRNVAVKILGGMDAKQLVRFQSEAKILSSLNHPHVVTILDFGINASSQPFMVLEYLEGETLGQFICKTGMLSNEQAIDLFGGIALALTYAHKNGIYHRDLKPDNIIVQRDSRSQIVAKLIDFGLASDRNDSFITTESGIALYGTPAYMPPDQARGLAFSEQSEIYSFGCALFEAVTGRPPFLADTAMELIAKHSYEEPVAPETLNPLVSPALSVLIRKCLQKSPDSRYASFDEIVPLLNRSEFPEDDPENDQQPVGEKLSTKKLPVYSLVGLLMLLCVVGFVIYQKTAPSADANKSATTTLPATEQKAESKMGKDKRDAVKLEGLMYEPENTKIKLYGDAKRDAVKLYGLMYESKNAKIKLDNDAVADIYGDSESNKKKGAQ